MDPWPEKERYRTPRDPVVMVSVCPSCGTRHQGAVPWCKNPNTPQEKTP